MLYLEETQGKLEDVFANYLIVHHNADPPKDTLASQLGEECQAISQSLYDYLPLREATPEEIEELF